MPIAPIRLKRNEERRLNAGHPWIFSNEIDVLTTPLSQFEPGQPVRIEAHNGKPLGCGYVNPASLICVRLTSRDPERVLDRSLLVHRLQVALSLRERLFDRPCYRLVHGEADRLPGLVIDRFGDVLAVQITTAGMERLRDDLLDALDKVVAPRCVVLRGDSPLREMEQLESYREVARGQLDGAVELEENGCRFTCDPLTGQKTGWYYDHRENRARLAPLSRGKRVLDLFSFTGAWGVQAAVAGAREVLCADASAGALEQVHDHAARNGVEDRVATLEGDAFDALRELRQARERFDVVIADPPAFIKRRKDFKNGLTAYRRLNQMAMQVLERDGLLVSASCSHHLPHEQLRDLLRATSRHLDRHLAIFADGRQGPDHPVDPAMPEGDYLKALFCRILPS